MYTVADPRLPSDEGDGHRGRDGDGDGDGRTSTLVAPASHASPAPPAPTNGPASTAVHRHVISRVQVSSVAKVASVFFSALALVALLAAAMLWIGAATAGLVGNAEGFMAELGFQEFSFDALQLLRGAIFAGLILVVAGTGTTVLAAILYNVVSDVVGGVELGARVRHNPEH